MLDCVANLLQEMVGPAVLVRAAHMELAEPLIPEGVEACVEAGATELVVFPYMLSPGKHSTRDIPRIVAEATRGHPELKVRVTPAFGVHAKLAEVIAERAGVEVTSGVAEGYGRSTPNERRNKLRISRGELAETQNHLKASARSKYMPLKKFHRIWNLTQVLDRMLAKLMRRD